MSLELLHNKYPTDQAHNPCSTDVCAGVMLIAVCVGQEPRLACCCRTPEYMSPELLHNGQDGTDQAYDPRSTDVWAAGVMLVVALCGAFPFDHTQHHHRSMEEAEIDLWSVFPGLL